MVQSCKVILTVQLMILTFDEYDVTLQQNLFGCTLTCMVLLGFQHCTIFDFDHLILGVKGLRRVLN